MLDFVKKYAKNVYSQNGEDGIIRECAKRIKGISIAVEFGGADGYYCSNTAALRQIGRHVRMYDLKAVDGLVEEKQITPENVNEIPTCNLLSIDIDGNDYRVWEAYKGKPQIVIIEINSSLKPTDKSSDPEKGTAYMPMVELGLSKGYFLLCHTGNLIFIDQKYKELFPEVKGDPLAEHEKYFNNGWL